VSRSASGWVLVVASLLAGAGCVTEAPARSPVPPPPASLVPAPAPSPPPPAAPEPVAPAAPALGWPVHGTIISGFGAVRGRRRHEGIDIKVPRGTVIRAAEAGLVIESRWRRGYGNVVSIEHGDGLRTVYAHMAQVWVRVGARVERGDAIATVGATGNATTPHLHFEVHRGGRLRDPLAWLGPPSVPASYDRP
jgi:murein DD-endopeptidase MepM/ murein hydrolase activator NlpD